MKAAIPHASIVSWTIHRIWGLLPGFRVEFQNFVTMEFQEFLHANPRNGQLRCFIACACAWLKILVHNNKFLLSCYLLIIESTSTCSLVRMELESSCLLCKKSVAKKRPLHSVNDLHLISTLVGLLDDIVDNTVLPKNSRVCPLVFSKFGESKQA